MSKLFKLKKWLTIPETEKYLTQLFGEEVTEADILRLALDGELTLSVNLVNGTWARRGKIISYPFVNLVNDAMNGNLSENFDEYAGLSDEEQYFFPYISQLNLDKYAHFKIPMNLFIHGVFDIPMFGMERLTVERRYQLLTDGPDALPIGLKHVFVLDGEDIYQLLEYFDNGGEEVYPFAEGLPEDAVFVVRTESLRQLQDRLANDSQSAQETKEKKDLDPREYLSLYKMLLSFAKTHYDYDPSKARQDATAKIKSLVERNGFNISDDNIRKHLKAAADQLD